MNGAGRFGGFVTVEDGRLCDAEGRPLLLRGMGLGNWLLPEGYMWRLAPGCESPRQIEALITGLVGEDRAAQFWRGFWEQFVTRDDVDRIAALGMNHVRLPINWRVVMDADGALRTDGLELIDRLIEWCRDAGIWVLLDLHGAPGGQTGTNIDDSLGQPDLFVDPRNEDLTVVLWVALAERFRTEPAVLGYDLLNEPLPGEWRHRYGDQLATLYRRLTAAIRAVDPDHVIVYEGTHWATDWSLFDEVWDHNSLLQFHKYWSPPDRPSIGNFVDTGARLGLPIYMGEGGENNHDWLATAFQLYEDLDIGWCFWPWKKLDTVTSPYSVTPPPGWADIVSYAQGHGAVPKPDDAWATLTALLANLALDRCVVRPGVLNAVFRRAPVSLPATAFGFTGPGLSYHTAAAVPLDGFRRDDAVTITYEPGDAAGAGVPNWHHDDGRPRPPHETLAVVLQEGEWVAFDVETASVTRHTIDVLAAATGDDAATAPSVVVDGTPIDAVPVQPGRWRAETGDVVTPGRHRIQVGAECGQLRLLRLDVVADDAPLVEEGEP